MSQIPGFGEDDVQIALRTTGDLLAAVPHRVGYQPSSDEIVVLFKPSGTSRTMFTVNWPASQTNQRAAQLAAETICRTVAADNLLVMGYGEQAAARVYALRQAIRDHDPGKRVGAFQVQHQQWRTFGEGVTGEWHHLPEVPVSVLLEGTPAPAASREDYEHRYQRLPQPTYGELPESTRALIDSSPPGIQADLAMRAVQRIADRDARALDMAALAHALNHPAVNHHVVAQVAHNRAQISVLVEAYRGAPPAHGPATATAAATAMWFDLRQAAAVQIISQVPAGHPYSAAASDLRALISASVYPPSLEARFRDAAADYLQQCERDYARGHEIQPEAPGFEILRPQSPDLDTNRPQL